MDMFQHIEIDENSRIPKYRQIVECVISNISIGNFKVGQKMPSINMFSEELLLSRHTVEKAYNILKDHKIISSARGKGYFIVKTQLISKINILFLVNKASSYKMRIYNSFLNKMGSDCHTDLHIYHCDVSLFLNLLDKNIGAYDYYIIMPHFKTENSNHISFTSEIEESINRIPKDRLVLMDNNKMNIDGDAIEIYQDFEDDIYKALNEGLTKIKKYVKLIMVYPDKSHYPYPKRILFGFRKFCAENSLDFEIINEVYEDMIIKEGDLFITIEESDLVNLVKQVRTSKLKLGRNIGIISYNDTPLKELLGITVVSTDFKKMGETAAQMLLEKRKGKIKNTFNFIDRYSL